jgi:hypothetical protein
MQRKAATWIVHSCRTTFCSGYVNIHISRTSNSKLSVMLLLLLLLLLLLRMLRMLLDLYDMLCILAWSLQWPVYHLKLLPWLLRLLLRVGLHTTYLC